MKILAIALKDMTRNFRSLFAVGMMFIAPLLITGLFYFAFSGLTGEDDTPPQIQTIKVGIVNQDEAVYGVRLGDQVGELLTMQGLTDFIQVTFFDSEEAARDALKKQEVGMFLLIPPDFSRAAMLMDRQATVMVVKDPTLSLGPSIVKNIVGQFLDGVSGTSIALKTVVDQAAARGIVLDGAAQQALAEEITRWTMAVSEDQNALLAVVPPEEKEKANPQPGMMGNILALIMGGQIVFFAFYTAAYTAASFVREDEEGTLPRLFTTPTARATILAGKFLAIFLMVIVQAVVLIVASTLIFNLKWGDWLPVLLAILGMIAAAGGFGLFVISFIRNRRHEGAVLGGVLTVTGMLGGLFTVSVPNMPAAFETINLLFPQGWAMRGFKTALSGGSAGEVLAPFLVCLVVGGILFAAGALIFRRRYA